MFFFFFFFCFFLGFFFFFFGFFFLLLLFFFFVVFFVFVFVFVFMLSFFFSFFFLSFIQCKFAISTLLSLFNFSYFITPYDAQASSAFSALILYRALKQHPVSKCYWSGFRFSM